jgi:N-acetylmuramoyl-L-alanine amidase
MRNYVKIVFFFALQLVSASVFAQQINVSALDFTSTPQQNRMIFAVTASPKHRVFVMDNPPRLVIDITNAKLKHSLAAPSADHPLFIRVRTSVQHHTDLRLVVDLKKPVTPKTFSLKTDNSDDHTLIIDLLNKELITPSSAKAPKVSVDDNKVIANKAIKDTFGKTIVVAIDAGHGGNDPGAHGIQGTEEKVITFAIAKKLAALINGQPGMKALMVRKGDYYVGLRERMRIARVGKADLFVSIHADAFQDTGVKGASVYTLSTNGASSEAARWLADTENAADMVGVSLHDKEDDLALTLFDLTQKDTREASVNLANQVLKSFDSFAQMHKGSVQKAGFMVLKSPDIPSILVETAFISNPSEEQNLLSRRFQEKMAQALFKGVRMYFKQAPSMDNKIAALEKSKG